jgi:hypothetical protein
MDRERVVAGPPCDAAEEARLEQAEALPAPQPDRPVAVDVDVVDGPERKLLDP